MLKLDIPDPTSQESVADWIELFIVVQKKPVSKAEVVSLVGNELGTEPSDDFIINIWGELETRMNFYGVHPPFIVESLEVVPNIEWEDNPEYVMCLILALTGNSVQPTSTGKLFERLSGEALKNYLSGDAIIVGHPSHHTIKSICDSTFEIFKQELPSNYNDRGVDVLGWKPFSDKRGNQIVILMQCAGGLNWTSKTGDVILRAWAEKYITFGCKPVRGFSTVVAITNAQEFEEVSFEADLLFDRPRIISNVISQSLDGTLRDEIKTWCDTRLQEINN